MKKKTSTEAKSAPAIEWIKGNRSIEWIGEINGKLVFEITDDGILFFKAAGNSIMLGYYSASRSAKRGAERFAKRMREIFA